MHIHAHSCIHVLFIVCKIYAIGFEAHMIDGILGCMLKKALHMICKAFDRRSCTSHFMSCGAILFPALFCSYI